MCHVRRVRLLHTCPRPRRWPRPRRCPFSSHPDATLHSQLVLDRVCRSSSTGWAPPSARCLARHSPPPLTLGTRFVRPLRLEHATQTRCVVLICALHHRCAHRQASWRHARLLGVERPRVPDHRPRRSVPHRGRTPPLRVIARLLHLMPLPHAPAHTPLPKLLVATTAHPSLQNPCTRVVFAPCSNASNPPSLVSICTGWWLGSSFASV